LISCGKSLYLYEVKVQKSKFDPSHVLVYLNGDDQKYIELKDKFEKHGLAFKHDRYVFFDVPELKRQGYFTNEYLTFIEAHEVAHSVLKHTKTSKYNEAEADYLAVLLCVDSGNKKSAKLGIQEFKSRNGIPFVDFEKKYKQSVLKKIKN